MPAELKHRLRIIDMMLSMHSRLGEIYNRRELLVDIGILVGSAIVVAGVFADGRILTGLGLSVQETRAVVRLLSLTVFILSIVSLRVDWSGSAREHRAAREELARLKHSWREAHRDELDDTELASLRDETDAVLSNMVAIPDYYFSRLKAHHYRKLRLSQALDDFPSAPVFLLRWKLAIEDSWTLLVGEGDDDEQDS